MTHPAETPYDNDPLSDDAIVPPITPYEMKEIIDDPEVGSGLRASATAFIAEGRSLEQIRDMLIANMNPGEFMRKLQELRASQMESTRKNTEAVRRHVGEKVIGIATAINPLRLFRK